jgi:hypothetical protein
VRATRPLADRGGLVARCIEMLVAEGLPLLAGTAREKAKRAGSSRAAVGYNERRAAYGPLVLTLGAMAMAASGRRSIGSAVMWASSPGVARPGATPSAAPDAART